MWIDVIGKAGGSIMSLRAALSTVAAASVAYTLSNTGAAAQSKTLYQRLGGYDAILAVVDQTIKNVAADRRINRFFANADVPRLRRNLADQVCVATGGWCLYMGRDMKSAHAGMHIHDRHFNALVQDLGKALRKYKVLRQERSELVGLLAPLRGDIVGHRARA
jgi:hemoglobin